MIKKILIIVSLILLVIATFILSSSYKSYRLSQEKCGDLAKQYGYEFVYIQGFGCMAKEAPGEQKKYEKEQIKEKGSYNSYYLSEADKSISANMRGMMVNAIEYYKKENGSYGGFTTDLTNGISNEFCTSKITILISSDGKNYTMYQPLCSDKEKIFCYDSASKTIIELSKNFISSIEKNYRCN